MKKKDILTITITLAVLAAAQVAYLAIPARLNAPFDRALRPVVYAAVLTALYVFKGKDGRPVPKGGQAALLSGIGAALYLAAVLIAGAVFGFSRNMMAPGFAAAATNAWTYGSVAVMSEFIRHKLIRSSPAQSRKTAAATVAAAYTFIALDALGRVAGLEPEGMAGLFFESILPVFVLNAVLSYMSLEGSLPSLLILRAAYSLFPVVSPVLPNVPRVAWSVATCAVLFVTLIAYHMNMADRSSLARRNLLRRAESRRKNIISLASFIAVLIGLSAVFAMRVFVYYPVAVSSGSMSGEFERGDVVFVQKLSTESARTSVIVGDVIHFTFGRHEVMHRVVEFTYDERGGRAYITKGDANPRPDADPVSPAQIIGISRSYIPRLGYPVLIVREMLGG